MEMPNIIKGVYSSYSTSQTVEIPTQDIECFRLIHESQRNGLQLIAIIKKELIDKYESSYSQIIIKGKYRLSETTLTIRNKDMPKFRPILYKEIMKQPTIVKTYGSNPGTPIARTHTISYKELKNEITYIL